MLLILLLVVPLAELSPGASATAGIVLLGLLAFSDAVAVSVLLYALAGADSSSLGAGDLLAHGIIVELPEHHHVRAAVLAARRRRAQRRARQDRSDPDFEFPQDATPRPNWAPRLGDYLCVSLTNAIAVSPTDTMPLAPGQGPDGGGVPDLLRSRDPRGGAPSTSLGS